MVGDLHGHRSLLEARLDGLQFDPGRDRVLSVGDLIDRGPDSFGTLSLLDEPWFHAVLGNHELALLNMLGLCAGKTSRKGIATGTGEWIIEALGRHRKRFHRLAARIAQLPLAIHVEGTEPFNVVHSDLHTLGGNQDALFASGSVSVHEAELATTSRENFGEASKSTLLSLQFAQHAVQISESPLSALPVTYIGHCPSRHVMVHNSYVHIDQGVCMRSKTTDARLPTVLDHGAFAYWLKGANSARTVKSATPRAEDRHTVLA